jgi:hypothetical protein
MLTATKVHVLLFCTRLPADGTLFHAVDGAAGGATRASAIVDSQKMRQFLARTPTSWVFPKIILSTQV